jgi:hypothetical protein
MGFFCCFVTVESEIFHFPQQEQKLPVEKNQNLMKTSKKRRTYAAVAAALVAVTTVDGRSIRAPSSRRFAIRTDTWARVQEDPLFEGWFKINLRCNKCSFETVVARIEDKWCQFNNPPHWNATFSIRDRVAICLHYLSHPSGYAQSSQVFGSRFSFDS